ncbi:MAG: VIT1/CCC1 transporter family protein [Chthoniobacter sp.]|nr:VIT1/CCC1 transporter family protein [Chthoniobacter sp.]
MSIRPSSKRVLDPLERFSEIVFGLIMVLSFTCAFSVAEAGREGVRAMLIGAIGCNFAWGIIDAAFYLIACLTEHGHQATLLRIVQQSPDATQARQAIAEVLPPLVAEALQPADFDRIHAHLHQLPPPPERPDLTSEDWRGSAGVFLLVFVSTLPVVVPFMFMHNARLALHVSNAIAIALLFGAGYMLAGFAGVRRVRTGLCMVAIGAALVALTIALGG